MSMSATTELLQLYAEGQRDSSSWNLAGADLRRARLKGINLAGAALDGATLMAANLRHADLTEANLQAAERCKEARRETRN